MEEYFHAESPIVRPVSIVSTQHFVNLARRQALNFGKVELVGPAAVPDGHNILHSKSVRRDDLVITSSANGLLHEEGEQDNAAINEDDLETRPRGLFADQFEVRKSHSFRGVTPLAKLSCRI